MTDSQTSGGQLDVNVLTIDELKEELRKLELPLSGSKAVLRERLRSSKRSCKTKPRSDDPDDEDDSESEDDEEVEERELPKRSQPLPFRDIEDSIQTFSGDGKQNVRRWIEDFEETSKVCLWSEAQKIIYAKKLLRGSAKLFVSYEKCAKSWKQMKRALIGEFSKTVNSRSIHKELAQTKKQNSESYMEYVYRMMEIASHADVELEATIQYVIDGIHDDPVNKTILYGAVSVKELRKKLSQYEAMKSSQKVNQSKTGKTWEKREKDSKEKESKGKEASRVQSNLRCFNCGQRNHVSADCPQKEKGSKCFQCKEFGHIAAQCPKRNTESTSVGQQVNKCGVAVKSDQKIYKAVKISSQHMAALLDTGSDLHLIRAERYIKLGALPLTGAKIVCLGLGENRMSTLGNFKIIVTIDNDDFTLILHVVPDMMMNHDMLLGSDLLKDANIQLIENNAIISRREDKLVVPCETDDVPEVFCINAHEIFDDGVQRQLDTDEIEMRPAIEKLIETYKPHAVKEVGIKLQIVVKDDIPVYQPPRRLASVEREQVNRQIEEWLRNGIIRPSVSEYASPVVLVKKKDGGLRLCVDYRKLNQKIVKDRYPTPLIEDQLDELQDATLFSTLDLENGFFHVPVHENSLPETKE
ncbi:uncharacterized protein LOC113562643 [Ooceraea biroi]|uniref:uncharacterized protein LOC113562643 n=1 Tax=Ooceraea biroi TaxID=2015173 RepID=UPI000F0999CB|nr:uncharacterized protein LOC113562643 [Ooceraea biroi]